MKAFLALCLVLVIATAAQAGLAPYWALDSGAVLFFAEHSMAFSGTPGVSCNVGLESPYEGISDDFVFDSEGDLCFTDYAINNYVDGQPSWGHFAPPIKVLDYPLTVGKTWTSTSNFSQPPSTNTVEVTYTGSVLRTEVVTTELGDFPVLVVQLVKESPLWVPRLGTSTYYLHEELGEIRGLVSVSGVVGTESQSWGGVKALFR